MSDVETKQASLEEKLAVTYKRLKITSIFFCIGWALVFIFFIGLSYYPGFSSGLASLLGFAGWAVAGGPLILRMLSSKGLKGAFALDSWEATDTYSDGTKKRDYGTENAMNAGSLLIFIIKIGLMVLIGFIVTVIYLLYLNIKYFVLYLRVKNKPVFLQSGVFLAIVCFAVLIGGLSLGVGIQKAGGAQYSRAAASQLLELETLIPVGSTAINRSYGTSLLAEPDMWSDVRVIKSLNAGDIVTVRAHRQGEDRKMWRVEHNGDIGYVDASRLRPNN